MILQGNRFWFDTMKLNLFVCKKKTKKNRFCWLPTSNTVTVCGSKQNMRMATETFSSTQRLKCSVHTPHSGNFAKFSKSSYFFFIIFVGGDGGAVSLFEAWNNATHGRLGAHNLQRLRHMNASNALQTFLIELKSYSGLRATERTATTTTKNMNSVHAARKLWDIVHCASCHFASCANAIVSVCDGRQFVPQINCFVIITMNISSSTSSVDKQMC